MEDDKKSNLGCEREIAENLPVSPDHQPKESDSHQDNLDSKMNDLPEAEQEPKISTEKHDDQNLQPKVDDCLQIPDKDPTKFMERRRRLGNMMLQRALHSLRNGQQDIVSTAPDPSAELLQPEQVQALEEYLHPTAPEDDMNHGQSSSKEQDRNNDNDPTGEVPNPQTGVVDNASAKNNSDSEWPAEPYITAEEEDGSKFAAIEIWFKSVEEPSMEDTVRYEAAWREEVARKKRLESRRLDEKQAVEDNQLFCHMDNMLPSSSPASAQGIRDDTTAGPSDATASTRTPATKRRRNIKLSDREQKKSMDVGLRAILAKHPVSKKKSTRGKGKDSTAGAGGDQDETGATSGRQRKPRTKTTRLTESEIGSIFCNGSVIADAQANASKGEIPTFSARDKSVALSQLVASIPAENQAEAISDKQRILQATRQFDHKARSDQKGGWQVKGLKTSLYHHQVLAVGWMRDREKSTTHPLGGLLCDVMGFGKTISALANILDGRPLNPDEPREPTLLVIPSNLITHWVQQINRWCECAEFGATLKHQSLTGLSVENHIKSIERHDVVITTYGEVRRSYPNTKVPDNLKTKEEINSWWIEHYRREAGPLHKIRWHRIVLDEAHAIKNEDSMTSIAVRALVGRHKWILSGTPLHNCVEEMYPYFDFLGVPHSSPKELFMRNYSKDKPARDRLVNMLRSILHRKTHESRLFSLPIIKLPNITETDITVKFCAAERLLYGTIIDVFLHKINDLSGPKHSHRQYQCVLVMILKLRMFASHVLTAQDILHDILGDGVLNKLRRLPRQDSSLKIVKFILAQNHGILLTAAPKEDDDEVARETPSSNWEKLARSFRDLMDSLHDEERWGERLERVDCPHCHEVPVGAFITSCNHLYCEECFYALPDQDGNIGTGTRVCCRCKIVIEEAAHCGAFDSMDPTHTVGPSSSAEPKEKRKRGQAKNTDGPNKKKRTSKGPKRNGMFSISQAAAVGSDQSESEDEDNREDWIRMIGSSMPGAKLTKVRELIREWIQKDEDVKIVVFTQFLNTIRLLESMCDQEKWKYTKMSGKMAVASRDKNITRFQEKKEIRVMIASLKTGGVGLDLSAANKCILMDLWWNEAIQEQAYCRLFRIGQTREVESIKLIVEKTIDERMLKLQKDKTVKIQEVISQSKLQGRDPIRFLIESFGEIMDIEGGGIHIIPKSKEAETQDATEQA